MILKVPVFSSASAALFCAVDFFLAYMSLRACVRVVSSECFASSIWTSSINANFFMYNTSLTALRTWTSWSSTFSSADFIAIWTATVIAFLIVPVATTFTN
jgi:hypothetical protein